MDALLPQRASDSPQRTWPNATTAASGSTLSRARARPSCTYRRDASPAGRARSRCPSSTWTTPTMWPSWGPTALARRPSSTTCARSSPPTCACSTFPRAARRGARCGAHADSRARQGGARAGALHRGAAQFRPDRILVGGTHEPRRAPQAHARPRAAGPAGLLIVMDEPTNHLDLHSPRRSSARSRPTPGRSCSSATTAPFSQHAQTAPGKSATGGCARCSGGWASQWAATIR